MTNWRMADGSRHVRERRTRKAKAAELARTVETIDAERKKLAHDQALAGAAELLKARRARRSTVIKLPPKPKLNAAASAWLARMSPAQIKYLMDVELDELSTADKYHVLNKVAMKRTGR